MFRIIFYIISAVTLSSCIIWSASGSERKVRQLYNDIHHCQSINLHLDNQNSTTKGVRLRFEERSIRHLIKMDYLATFDYSWENDTMYTLERTCIEDHSVEFAVWNKNDTLFFVGNDNGINLIEDKPVFSAHMMKLVSEWCDKEILQESKINGYLPITRVVASRVVFKNNEYQIECISFDDFYKLEWDYDYFKQLKKVTK